MVTYEKSKYVVELDVDVKATALDSLEKIDVKLIQNLCIILRSFGYLVGAFFAP